MADHFVVVHALVYKDKKFSVAEMSLSDRSSHFKSKVIA